MENYNGESYIERSKEVKGMVFGSKVVSALESLQNEARYEKTFSKEGWESFEKNIEGLGFTKKDTEGYISNVASYHGNEILVRRASMKRLLDDLEKGEVLEINPIDKEPNATLLGRDASGIESALSSGFGWVVENKVAGVFGFSNNESHMQVNLLEEESMSNAKKSGDLMRRVSGDLKKEDVLFLLFRIHRSVYPESLLVDEDFDSNGNVNNFILRLYAKNRQTH